MRYKRDTTRYCSPILTLFGRIKVSLVGAKGRAHINKRSGGVKALLNASESCRAIKGGPELDVRVQSNSNA